MAPQRTARAINSFETQCPPLFHTSRTIESVLVDEFSSWAIISKNVRNWRPQMPKTNFNKVSTLWTCQTYMENMSTALKPNEISFGVLFFWHKLRQFRTFLKLLPIFNILNIFPHKHLFNFCFKISLVKSTKGIEF